MRKERSGHLQVLTQRLVLVSILAIPFSLVATIIAAFMGGEVVFLPLVIFLIGIAVLSSVVVDYRNSGKKNGNNLIDNRS